jgi:hypothetical protein
MYKQIKDPITGKLLNCVQRTSDLLCIPFADDNTDYQAYLKWVAEGGQVLPADSNA